jgi:hypothetical protein
MAFHILLELKLLIGQHFFYPQKYNQISKMITMASNSIRLGNPLVECQKLPFETPPCFHHKISRFKPTKVQIGQDRKLIKITQRLYKTNSYLFHAYFVEIQWNPYGHGHGHGIILKIKFYTQVHASSQHALKSFNIKTLRCHFSINCNFWILVSLLTPLIIWLWSMWVNNCKKSLLVNVSVIH